MLAFLSAQQSSLAAGAETFLNLTIPAGSVIPTTSTGYVSPYFPLVTCLEATFISTSCLVAEAVLSGSNNVITVNIKNVGSGASASWYVVVVLFGPTGGQATAL